jgi:hypothetical protein
MYLISRIRRDGDVDTKSFCRRSIVLCGVNLLLVSLYWIAAGLGPRHGLRPDDSFTDKSLADEPNQPAGSLQEADVHSTDPCHATVGFCTAGPRTPFSKYE